MQELIDSWKKEIEKGLEVQEKLMEERKNCSITRLNEIALALYCNRDALRMLKHCIKGLEDTYYNNRITDIEQQKEDLRKQINKLTKKD